MSERGNAACEGHAEPWVASVPTADRVGFGGARDVERRFFVRTGARGTGCGGARRADSGAEIPSLPLVQSHSVGGVAAPSVDQILANVPGCPVDDVRGPA